METPVALPPIPYARASPLHTNYLSSKKSCQESTQLGVVAGFFFSLLCSPCFTHEFGEFAVEPQWILKKGCVSGFGVPGRGTGATFFKYLITHGREDHCVAQTLSHQNG